MNCPRCRSKVNKNGTRNAKQRYKCSICHYEYEVPFWKEKAERGNVLAFSCVHLPFEREGYLDFLVETKHKYNCTNVICLGDLFDNHAISYHESDPDGHSAGDEFVITKERVTEWVQAFPDLKITYGNHDDLPFRKAKTHGIPRAMIKTWNEMYDIPDSWEWDWFFVKDNVKYFHGLGKSGKYAHVNHAKELMQSTVTGHIHTAAGVGWYANHNQIGFGLGVGCGIDEASYAMAYGKHWSARPILGCGVVSEEGKHAEFIPMRL